jgi:amino acid adenylation domain-containing protein
VSVDGEGRGRGADGDADVAGGDPAYCIFTSGSTGVPKGALIEHAGMLNHLDAKIALLELGPSDRVAQTAAASFDISIWQCVAPLLVGAEVEILGDDVARNPVALHTAVAERGITILEVVPVVLRGLLDVDELSGAGGRLRSLRWLVVTGEALSPALCRRWFSRYPMIPLVNAYGPTECADDVTHHVMRTAPATSEAHTPIGMAIPGVTVHVLDAELQPVPDGTPGEICVDGIAVGRGYVNDPARTAAAFVTPDPATRTPGSRLYRTGDRGRRRSDGTLEWLGRLDGQLKILGTRVEPAEVEAVLATHPAVREAAVLGRTHDHASTHLVGFVALDRCVHAEGTRDDRMDDARVGLLEEIRAFVRERLPAAFVPSTLIVLERLPRTPNGKVDYEELSVLPVAPVRGSDPSDGLVEHAVAALWIRLLGAERVTRDDTFFALGGDSLLAHRMLLDVRGTFGAEIGIDVFLACPTVAGLASAIAARQLDGLALDEVDALLTDIEAMPAGDAAQTTVIDDG